MRFGEKIWGGHVSSFERRGPLARGAMFLLSRGGVHWHGGGGGRTPTPPPPPPHGLGVCLWMHLVNGTGNSPSPRQPTPGVVKQDKLSRGSVDATKTRSGPQRVRMSSGERPIGAADGKQSDTEALCQPPPPPPPPANSCQRCRPQECLCENNSGLFSQHQPLHLHQHQPTKHQHSPRTSTSATAGTHNPCRPKRVRICCPLDCPGLLSADAQGGCRWWVQFWWV